jgi:hypothetical protein
VASSAAAVTLHHRCILILFLDLVWQSGPSSLTDTFARIRPDGGVRLIFAHLTVTATALAKTQWQMDDARPVLDETVVGHRNDCVRRGEINAIDLSVGVNHDLG